MTNFIGPSVFVSNIFFCVSSGVAPAHVGVWGLSGCGSSGPMHYYMPSGFHVVDFLLSLETSAEFVHNFFLSLHRWRYTTNGR